MTRFTLLSLAEITVLEDAAALGASTAEAAAAAALHARWQAGVRDAETFVRLLFLLWGGCANQGRLPQPNPYPSPEELIGEAGGEQALPAETLFVLGFVAAMAPYCLGPEAEWEARSRELLALAAAREPRSRLLRNWAFFVGDADDTRDPRIYITPEIHARFSGRGELGRYMEQMLLSRLRPGPAPA